MRFSPFAPIFGPEGYFLLNRVDDARRLAMAGAAVAAEQGQAGFQAHAHRLLGNAEVRRGNPAEADHHYQEALRLAEERGMRPLVAHCHAGLAKLYRWIGKRAEAEEHFRTATALYREMGMAYWLEQAEAEMKELS